MRRLHLLSVVALLLAVSAQSAYAAPPTPHALVARYFAAIKAHHYRVATALEATCSKTLYMPDGHGAIIGSESFHGRAAPVENFSTFRVVRITRIAPVHLPVLNRDGIKTFGVSGWFTFDYSRIPWANIKHQNGFHTIKIGVWKCNGRWGIQGPEWLVGSGGDLNWT